MIEVILLNFLKKNMSVPVDIKERTDKEFIVIEKTGGGKENHIYEATFAIQSYSTTLYGAAELNETLKNIMDKFAEEDEICSCSLNSDYNFTDFETKRYRYQAVFNIVHY